MLSRRDIRVTFAVTELVSDRRMRKRDIDLGLVNQAWPKRLREMMETFT